jgi:steroid delta-isomerase-like uncharacterized protein
MGWSRSVAAAGLAVMTIIMGLAGVVGAQDATPAADCPATSPEENAELVRGYLNTAHNDKDPETAVAFLADDFVRNSVARPHMNEPGSADDVQRIVDNLQDFPDLQLSVDDVVAEGDRVAVRFTWSGTHSDTFDPWGAPATGKPTAFWGMAFYRVECGVLAEQWVMLDYLTMGRELGIISDEELQTIEESAESVLATPEP